MNFLVARAQESKIIYLYTRFVYYEGTTTFGQKSTTFYFCFRSMQKPSKRVNTQKKIYLGVPPHPPVNRGCQPVKGYCQRGVKISLSSLINFFPFQGILSIKKIFRQKKLVPSPQLGEGGGVATLWWAPPKSTNFFFLTPPLT